MTYAQAPPPLPPPGRPPAPERSKSPRAVIWLLAVLVVGVAAAAALLVVQLLHDMQAEEAAQERHDAEVERWAAIDAGARARVTWLAQEYDASRERWNDSYEKADELREECVDGEDVGFDWVTELGVALAHADRALEAGNAASEGAYATGQPEMAGHISDVLGDNVEFWAAERTRYEVLVSTPLALNCQ